jgi:predicted nicotinamide N-methyase
LYWAAALGAASDGAPPLAAALGAAALGAADVPPPLVQAAANTASAAKTTSHFARVEPRSIMRTPPHVTAHRMAAPPNDDAPMTGGI